MRSLHTLLCGVTAGTLLIGIFGLAPTSWGRASSSVLLPIAASQSPGPRSAAPKSPGKTPSPGKPHTPAKPKSPPQAGNRDALRPATDGERKGVISSITSQLDAFRKDDYARAIFYQSSGLKEQFPSVEAFRQMMKKSYPEFTNYKNVEFGRAIAEPGGEHVAIQVTLMGKDVVTVHATYLMVLEEKIYRVESVFGGTPSLSGPTIST